MAIIKEQEQKQEFAKSFTIKTKIDGKKDDGTMNIILGGMSIQKYEVGLTSGKITPAGNLEIDITILSAELQQWIAGADIMFRRIFEEVVTYTPPQPSNDESTPQQE